LYDFLLTVHVLAAVLWVGGGASLHAMLRRMQKNADRAALLDFLGEAGRFAAIYYAALSVIMLIAGLLLVGEAQSGAEFKQAWVQIGLTIWVISLVIGVGYYGRQGKKIGELAESEGPEGKGVERAVNQYLLVNSIELTLLLLAVVDMTTKPGL
jgi:uncharacterized membrane protein